MLSVVIPVAKKDLEILKYTVKYIYMYFGEVKIHILTSKDNFQDLSDLEDVILIDENKILKNLNFDAVRNILLQISNNDNRTGWYFQQFLKMAFSYYCEDDNYLIWDADTFPLKKIPLVDFEENKILFSVTLENHMPYFKTLNKLFDGEVRKYSEYSFISEHMVINKKHMMTLVQMIENNNSLNGKTFFEKILNSIEPEDINASGFSEFETYGNFVYRFYQEEYKIISLKSFRHGSNYFDYKNELQIHWISSCLDMVSFEHWNNKRSILFQLLQNEILIKNIKFYFVYNILNKYFIKN